MENIGFEGNEDFKNLETELNNLELITPEINVGLFLKSKPGNTKSIDANSATEYRFLFENGMRKLAEERGRSIKFLNIFTYQEKTKDEILEGNNLHSDILNQYKWYLVNKFGESNTLKNKLMTKMDDFFVKNFGKNECKELNRAYQSMLNFHLMYNAGKMSIKRIASEEHAFGFNVEPIYSQSARDIAINGPEDNWSLDKINEKLREDYIKQKAKVSYSDHYIGS